MRSYNEAWAIEDTLTQVFAQDYNGEIELIVIDSGSTDGSHEIIRRFNPKHFIILEPGTYVPGKVLNQGFQLATADWVVFLNSDATPANEQWLGSLLQAAISQPKPGALFSRQIPRPDCQAVVAHDYEKCFGPNRQSIHWDHFFSMVSCIAARALGVAEPIREDLQYAEDDAWTRTLKASGYAIELVENSIVIHSHNYTPEQAYKRSKGDAIALSKAGNAPCQNDNWFTQVFLASFLDTLRDAKYFLRTGKASEIQHAARIRYQQRLGRLHGTQEALRSE
jgi:rhamnosyltransferase